MGDLVSVCLMTYNHEKYIDDAIQGIIDQTYSPLELIILDDASTDNTVKIIKEKIDSSRSRFENVKLIFHDQNCGNIPKNENEMLKSARGRYIKDFSGDDVMFPKCIEILVAAAVKHDDAILIHANGFIEHEEYRAIDEHSWRTYRDHPTGYENGNLFLQLMYTNPILAPTVLYKRELFERYGFYNEEYIYEDYEMWLRIAFNGERVFYCNSPLVAYRRTEGSVSNLDINDNKKRAINHIKAVMQSRENYFRYLDDDEKKLVCQYLYWMYSSIADNSGLSDYTDLLDRLVPVTVEKKRIINHSYKPSTEKLNTESGILCEWIDHYEELKALFKKWDKKGITVAIYGYSRIGKRLYNALNVNQVPVKYVIDQKRDAVYASVPVYSIDDALPDVDIVVVTAIGGFESIRRNLANKLGAEVICLMDLIFQHNID